MYQSVLNLLQSSMLLDFALRTICLPSIRSNAAERKIALGIMALSLTVHLADPPILLNFVNICLRVPSHRFRVSCDCFMMEVDWLLLYWGSHSCLMVIGNMLLA